MDNENIKDLGVHMKYENLSQEDKQLYDNIIEAFKSSFGCNLEVEYYQDYCNDNDKNEVYHKAYVDYYF